MTKLKEILCGHAHAFDVGIAKVVGLNAAVVFNHILYWLRINARKKDAEKHDGKYWMYETQKQMADFFEYLSEDDVCRAIKKLLDEGLIIKGNFNKTPFDKTSWYTIEDQDLIINESEIQKSFTKPRNRGIAPAKSRNHDRDFAECYNNVQEENTEKKHHHKGDDDSSSKQQTTYPEQIDPGDLRFTEHEREQLNNYTAEQIESAMKSLEGCNSKANSSRVKYFFKTLATQSNKKPSSSSSNEEYAREEIQKWDIPKNVTVEFYNDYVEFSFKDHPVAKALVYKEIGFADQLANFLRKCNAKKKNNDDLC